MLLQLQPNGDLKPVAYFSRTTTATEAKNHSYELETLAVVERIKQFRVYLIGISFRVVTDCAALIVTLLKRDLVLRIARWCLTNQEYDFQVECRVGVCMQQVDALSRNPIRVNLLSVEKADWFHTVQFQDQSFKRL